MYFSVPGELEDIGADFIVDVSVPSRRKSSLVSVFDQVSSPPKLSIKPKPFRLKPRDFSITGS
ncbi:hypothetical protein LINPERPRIM_LOCUS14582 [Linum perenne]